MTKQMTTMIRRLLFVYWSFSVCAFPMCSAGYTNKLECNVATLNDILKASQWEKLVEMGQVRELISTDGQVLDVSDLLNEDADGNVVTPENYTDKLVKSSAAANCFYGGVLKWINDLVVKIIAGHCMRLDSDVSKLDCIERFWNKMDTNKSLVEKLLAGLNVFHEAVSVAVNAAGTTTTVVEILEFLKPLYDRRIYNKSYYLDGSGAVSMVALKTNHENLIGQLTLANQALWDFLVAHCRSRTCTVENEKSEDIENIEYEMNNTEPDAFTERIFELYDDILTEGEYSLLSDLGLNEKKLIV